MGLVQNHNKNIFVVHLVKHNKQMYFCCDSIQHLQRKRDFIVLIFITCHDSTIPSKTRGADLQMQHEWCIMWIEENRWDGTGKGQNFINVHVCFVYSSIFFEA